MTSGQGMQSQAAGGQWPKQLDFRDALQNPQIALKGDSVEGAQVIRLPRGNQPMAWSGTFAAVYKIEKEGAYYAIRCFMSPVTDQEERYTNLSNFLNANYHECLVGFEYLKKGISVKGYRYPLVKMDWVEGERLDGFVGRIIEKQPNNLGMLSRVADSWRSINGDLRNLGVAHNDLQHGNVIIQENLDIRLVDYDSFFLPDSVGDSPEGGHGNYQHPKRKASDYNQHVDNFPALVIYLSLLALASHPNLWNPKEDRKLLFAEQDFKNPSSSDVFRDLKGSSDNRVKTLTNYLERYCSVPVELVPNLVLIASRAAAGEEDAPELTPSPSKVQASRSTAPSSSPLPTQRGKPDPDDLLKALLWSPPAQGGQPQTPTGHPQIPLGTQPQQPQQSGRGNPGSAAGRRAFQRQGRQPIATPSGQQVRSDSTAVNSAGGQAVATPPQAANGAAPAVVGPVQCKRGHRNRPESIYCGQEQCAEVLYPGDKVCVSVKCLFKLFKHPANAKYCPRCGRRLS